MRRAQDAGLAAEEILELLAESRDVLTIVEGRNDKRALERFGFDPALADETTRWLQAVIDTPLLSGRPLCLARIDRARRIDEMAFCFPVPDLDRSALRALLKRHYREGPLHHAIDRLDVARLRGYLRGFIDLIIEQDGQYWLIDYKSNYLGPQVADYTPAALTEAVAGAHYYLQYLIYLVALHRMLRLRLTDYDYQRHIGGVCYLFLRGMSPATGPRHGIYRDKPPLALIEALDRLFAGEENE